MKVYANVGSFYLNLFVIASAESKEIGVNEMFIGALML